MQEQTNHLTQAELEHIAYRVLPELIKSLRLKQDTDILHISDLPGFPKDYRPTDDKGQYLMRSALWCHQTHEYLLNLIHQPVMWDKREVRYDRHPNSIATP
jgi:hypothetical protein